MITVYTPNNRGELAYEQFVQRLKTLQGIPIISLIEVFDTKSTDKLKYTFTISNCNFNFIISHKELRRLLLENRVTTTAFRLTKDNRLIRSESKGTMQAKSCEELQAEIDQYYRVLEHKCRLLNKPFVRDYCRVIGRGKVRLIEANAIIDDTYIIPPFVTECIQPDKDTMSCFGKVSGRLKVINRSNNLVSMARLFYGCNSIRELDLTEFSTKGTISTAEMFSYCTGLTTIYGLETFDMSSVIVSSRMFANCYILQDLNINQWDMPETRSAEYMFQNCKGLQTLDLSAWRLPKCETVNNMFFNCSMLQSLNIENFAMTVTTDCSSMFTGCDKLKALNLNKWSMQSVRTATYMFRGCHQLKYLIISEWNTKSMLCFRGMFEECIALKELDLSKWNTSVAVDMRDMFARCNVLQTLNISTWNVSNVTLFNGMFAVCVSLQHIDLGHWRLNSAVDTTRMFASCRALKAVDVTAWRPVHLEQASEMFFGCSSLEKLDLSTWRGVPLKDAMRMFADCEKIQTLDLRGITTETLIVSRMCINCQKLKDIWLPKSKPIRYGSNSADSQHPFEYCIGLSEESKKKAAVWLRD